ncbi:MAG: prepilin-type N-terminal cleavage/methylation domain-containing protein [Elusimicrobiaceae bacterium]|nr:prepilin-type N-terminal cleavage/methylation domain-containing protein [Elusimicrobiaceae bacterium]
MYQHKQAFTLIELLVVVLIIGILAAVAVPQYRKVVYKARTVEAVNMLKAISDAQEVYWLANGKYTNNIHDLDVDIAEERVCGEASPSQFYCFSCHSSGQCDAGISDENMPNIESLLVHRSGGHWLDTLWCIAHNGVNPKSDMALSICQSMGQKEIDVWIPGYYFRIK